jgi:hypothetical protein
VSHRFTAAVGALLLLAPAAASARPGDPDHPGNGNGPPPWAQGQQGKPDTPGSAPVQATEVAEPPAEDIGGAPLPAVVAPELPAQAPARAKSQRGKGRSKPVVFMVRGTVVAVGDEALEVTVTGGNRRGRLRGATLSVRPRVVIVDDEISTLGAVREGDRVVFQVRLPRGTTAAAVDGATLESRRLIDVTEHEDPPAEEPAPVDELAPVAEPVLDPVV